MSDLISRQAAIDAIQGIDRLATLSDNDAVVRMSAVEHVLFNLPSAQSLTAYVISDEDGNIKCSNCGSFDCWGNYCMNCGAKMRGAERRTDG